MRPQGIVILRITHRGLNKMAAIFETTLPHACWRMRNFVIWFKFHWSLFWSLFQMNDNKRQAIAGTNHDQGLLYHIVSPDHNTVLSNKNLFVNGLGNLENIISKFVVGAVLTNGITSDNMKALSCVICHTIQWLWWSMPANYMNTIGFLTSHYAQLRFRNGCAQLHFQDSDINSFAV